MNPPVGADDQLMIGLFAGIGGIELGFERAGYRTAMLVENEAGASHVLRSRFPDAKLEADIRDVTELPPETQIVTAGFPCQDLSSVGLKLGIEGTKSSLVGEVIRLVQHQPVPWLVLENVPFIRDLDRGRALRLITTALMELGYKWAYRVVDARSFGLPQRRLRWYLVASLVGDPRSVLLSQDSAKRVPTDYVGDSFGFYWTEGTRSLGWAPDSIPPLKCGSTIGIASPPAILLPTGKIVTPDIRDAERLQGFRANWTKPAEEVDRPSFRWRLVGNSVSVRAASWLARRIRGHGTEVPYDSATDGELDPSGRWPSAAWWDGTTLGVSPSSPYPIWCAGTPIHHFLAFEPKPLSARASNGFLKRAEKGSLRFRPGFLDTVRQHAERQQRFESR